MESSTTKPGRAPPHRFQHLLQRCFRQHRQIEFGQTEPLRAHAHLAQRFLAGYVERRKRTLHRREHLQQQGRLADAWIAANQHHRARHDAAAEHAIHLRHAGAHPAGGFRLDIGQPQNLGLSRSGRAAHRHTAFSRFHQRVPFAAIRALASPLARAGAATWQT